MFDFKAVLFPCVQEVLKEWSLHWHDPEGWDGEGGARGVQDGEHM